MMAQFSRQRMTVISVYVNMVPSTVQTLRRVVNQVGISCSIRKPAFGLNFRPGPSQTGIYSHRRRLEGWNFGFKK